MGRYDDYYPPYVSMDVRRAQAAAAVAKLSKKLKRELHPVVIEGTAIAKSFWGKAWCENIAKEYASEANRLPRGRSYVRAGAVVDLSMEPGCIKALVQGSRKTPYEVTVQVDPLSEEQKEHIRRACRERALSALDLLQGKMPKALLEFFRSGKEGIFPRCREMEFDCSCPDWESLCKHLAAVLYAVGHRLDEQPELLFSLRGMDIAELVAETAEVSLNSAPETELGETDLSSMFGIDLAPADMPPTETPLPAQEPKPLKKVNSAAPTKSLKQPKKPAVSAKEKTFNEKLDYIARYTAWTEQELAQKIGVSKARLKEYKRDNRGVPTHRRESVDALFRQVQDIVREIKAQRKKS